MSRIAGQSIPPDYKSKKVSKTPQNIQKHTIEKEGVVVGKNKKVIHPDEVRKLAALGCTKTDIANYLGITTNTLIFNFNDDYIHGYEEMKLVLRKAMLDTAVTNKNPTMLIWLSKQYLGMTDQPTDTDDKKVLPWNDNF